MTTSYDPPSAELIARAQDEDKNLELLLVQRRLYSRAKIWSGVRGVGVGIIAIAAPVLTAIWPSIEVLAATVAALWFVFNRLLFRPLERRGASLAATVQEQFDVRIFGMPTIAVRDPRILPEEIVRLAGGRVTRRRAYAAEKLRGWYPIQIFVPGRVAIAIAQRANVAYSQTLLARSAAFWLICLCAWGAVALAIGLWAGFTLATFLLVLAIPILPPLLDAVDEALEVRRAGKERRALANDIEDAIAGDPSTHIRAEDLIAWQAQLFALRRSAPLVPDWLYWLLRPRTEDEMNAAATRLGSGSNEEDKQ